MVGDLESIALFTRVIKEGSFSAAARDAGVSPSAISKRIARLEAQLGVTLLHRTTRKIALTDAGQHFYDSCAQDLQQIKSAEESLSRFRETPHGLVRVRAPQAFGRKFITPFIPQFLAENPDVQLDVIYGPLVGDHMDEKIDVLVASADPHDINLPMRVLTPLERVTCASRRYLEQHKMPPRFSDLSNHQCLVFSGSDSPEREWILHSDNAVQRVRVNGNFRTNNAEAIYAAVLAGIGIAHMPTFIAEPGLLSGDLVEIFRDKPGRTGATMNVYLPHAKYRLPKVEAFVDFLVRACRSQRL